MNKDRAISFLKTHQPMPDDTNLDKDIIDEYDQVRKYFLDNPDEECIPLFLNSFGEIDGYGVYQLVEDVLLNFDKEKILVHLEKSLLSEYRSVRYWSTQMAASFPDKRLISPLSDLLIDQDPDIKMASITALSQINEPQIIVILKEALIKENDEEVSEFLEEVISDLINNI